MADDPNGLSSDRVFMAQVPRNLTVLRQHNPKNKRVVKAHNNHIMGVFDLQTVLERFRPHIMICLNDHEFLVEYGQVAIRSGVPCKRIAYMPIDAENYKHRFFTGLGTYDEVWTMNEKSRRIIEETQSLSCPIRVLEHPIFKSFFPLEPSPQLAAFRAGLVPSDAPIILNVNRNDFRKRLDLTIESFYEYMMSQPESKAHLILKTEHHKPHDSQSHDLQAINAEMAEAYGENFGSRILVLDEKLTLEELNMLYNVADVFLTTTSGEGWGLTAFEAMSAGTRCIVPANTCYSEYFPPSLQVETKPHPIATGRYMMKQFERRADQWVVWMQGVRSQSEGSIHHVPHDSAIEALQGADYFLVGPGGNQSLVEALNYIQAKQPVAFQIAVCVDFETQCQHLAECCNERERIGLGALKGYDVIALQDDAFDHFITKVLLPEPGDVAKAIEVALNGDHSERLDDEIVDRLRPEVIAKRLFSYQKS